MLWECHKSAKRQVMENRPSPMQNRNPNKLQIRDYLNFFKRKSDLLIESTKETSFK